MRLQMLAQKIGKGVCGEEAEDLGVAHIVAQTKFRHSQRTPPSFHHQIQGTALRFGAALRLPHHGVLQQAEFAGVLHSGRAGAQAYSSGISKSAAVPAPS